MTSLLVKNTKDKRRPKKSPIMDILIIDVLLAFFGTIISNIRTSMPIQKIKISGAKYKKS
jgi:hypothetical protein